MTDACAGCGTDEGTAEREQQARATDTADVMQRLQRALSDASPVRRRRTP